MKTRTIGFATLLYLTACGTGSASSPSDSMRPSNAQQERGDQTVADAFTVVVSGEKLTTQAAILDAKFPSAAAATAELQFGAANGDTSVSLVARLSPDRLGERSHSIGLARAELMKPDAAFSVGGAFADAGTVAFDILEGGEIAGDVTTDEGVVHFEGKYVLNCAVPAASLGPDAPAAPVAVGDDKLEALIVDTERKSRECRDLADLLGL